MKNGTRRDLLQMFLWTVLSCGFYYLWWVYQTTKEIEEFTEEKGIPPIVHVILIVCTGTIWGIVWDILTAQKIEKMQQMMGLPPRPQGLLYLALDLLGAGPVAGLGIAVPFLQQNELNAIYDAAANRSTWYRD